MTTPATNGPTPVDREGLAMVDLIYREPLTHCASDEIARDLRAAGFVHPASILDMLRMEMGRRRDNPGRSPEQYRGRDADAWRAGYAWAMNEAGNVIARKKWDLEARR